MGVWTELVGVRKDLRLRGKWWHHVAVGAGVFSALIVYLIVAGLVVKRPPKLTTSNTFSETLLHEAIARQSPTTLADLDALGSRRQCQRRRRFRPADASGRSGYPLRKSGAVQSRPDGQGRRDELPGDSGSSAISPPASAGTASPARHLPGSPPTRSRYTSRTDRGRKLAVQGFVAGLAGSCVWLILYWNVYYRGLMPIYARRRQLRRRRHVE